MGHKMFIPCKELNIVRVAQIFWIFSSTFHMLPFKRLSKIVIRLAFF